MSCLCLPQSISCPAGGERCSEPPTCSGAPAVDSPQAELVDSPAVTYESLSSRVSSELCSSAWRLHLWIPNKGKTCVCACACVCVCVCAHLSGWCTGSCQAVNNTSGCAESGHCQSGVDVRAKAMTWLCCCFVITENNVLDVVIFEFIASHHILFVVAQTDWGIISTN